MYPEKLLLIVVFGVLVSGELDDRRKSRNPRLFSFNSVDDDIAINLEFSIPFLSIPTKKTMDSTFGLWSSGLPTININPTSLAMGGAVVLGTTILIPLLLKSFAAHHPQHRYSRLLDTTEFSTDAVLDFATQMLADNRSVRGCALRVACWSSQKATNIDSVRTWKQIISNQLVSTIINSTAIEDAMLSGRKGRDCMTYTPCPLREEYLPVLLNNLAVLTNSVG